MGRFLKLLLVLLAITFGLLGLQSTKAIANYHGNWNEQPDMGWWDWLNNDPNSNYVTWRIRNYWGTARAQALRDSGKDFHFELEAYDPSHGRFCDNLEIGYFEAETLPIKGSPLWGQGNCGYNEPYPEELKVTIRNSDIQAGVWYYAYVQLLKRRATPVVDPVTYNAEVNLSFADKWFDSWLGKYYYKRSPAYDFAGSDPSGL